MGTHDDDPRHADLFAAIDDALEERPGACCRCLAPVARGGFCSDCRAFLLGDSGHDPAAAGVLSADAIEGIINRWHNGRGLMDRLLTADAYLWLDNGESVTGEPAIEIVKREAGLV